MAVEAQDPYVAEQLPRPQPLDNYGVASSSSSMRTKRDPQTLMSCRRESIRFLGKHSIKITTNSGTFDAEQSERGDRQRGLEHHVLAAQRPDAGRS